jgi:peptidoglycan/LPS O-acetylase OafA/YrhL
MDSPERTPRYHALDGVRAFAMLLGVFLHASVPYLHVNFPWAVVDSSRSISLTLVIYGIHSFRMPAFFLIAGFFARLVFRRAGLGSFARHRTQRILLPLVAGWLVLHPVVRALWVWSGIRAMDNSSTSDLWIALSTVFSSKFITRGLGLMHLWFLYYLLVLYVAFLLVRWIFVRLDADRHRRRELDSYFERLVSSPWSAAALAVPTTWVLMMMHGWGVDIVTRGLLPRPVHILFYGSFFAFGWMLHRNPSLLAPLRARWPLHLAVATALLVPLIWLLYLVYELHHNAGPWFRISYFLMYGCMSWSFVLALLGIFQRFFDRPSRWWRYLADASYWIYLVHLPIVICISILLREVQIGWYVKLPIVIVASTPVLIGSYQLLVRSTWIGVVLNGRRLP